MGVDDRYGLETSLDAAFPSQLGCYPTCYKNKTRYLKIKAGQTIAWVIFLRNAQKFDLNTVFITIY